MRLSYASESEKSRKIIKGIEVAPTRLMHISSLFFSLANEGTFLLACQEKSQRWCHLLHPFLLGVCQFPKISTLALMVFFWQDKACRNKIPGNRYWNISKENTNSQTKIPVFVQRPWLVMLSNFEMTKSHRHRDSNWWICQTFFWQIWAAKLFSYQL